jgi:hypothetical protein
MPGDGRHTRLAASASTVGVTRCRVLCDLSQIRPFGCKNLPPRGVECSGGSRSPGGTTGSQGPRSKRPPTTARIPRDAPPCNNVGTRGTVGTPEDTSSVLPTSGAVARLSFRPHVLLQSDSGEGMPLRAEPGVHLRVQAGLWPGSDSGHGAVDLFPGGDQLSDHDVQLIWRRVGREGSLDV